MVLHDGAFSSDARLCINATTFLRTEPTDRNKGLNTPIKQTILQKPGARQQVTPQPKLVDGIKIIGPLPDPASTASLATVARLPQDTATRENA